MKHSITLIILFLWINTAWTQSLSKTNNSQISVEQNIEFIGQWNTSNNCKSSYISGNTAYITNNNKLEILDISDPTSPNLIGEATLSTSFLSEDIFGKGDNIYLANYKTIYLFDVSDPTNPDTVISFKLESIVNDIHIVGDQLYVIASYDFYILDISDPTSITQLGFMRLPDASLGLTRFHIEGDYAYIGSWSDGLYIIDISNASNPIMKGRFFEEASYIVFAQGPYAYVANGSHLYILDITDKVIPYIIVAAPSVGKTHDIFVDDKNVYTATDNGMIIYNKEDLSFIASYSLSDVSERLFVANGLTHLSSNSEGLNILKYIGPTVVEDSEENTITFELKQNYPNPFNPSTTIRYSIPSVVAGHAPTVLLNIYDVLGREVAMLVNEQQQPGNYKAEFQAEGLPSGIYFYQLRVNYSDGTANNYIETKKMTLIK